jgi:hypothetical protein
LQRDFSLSVTPTIAARRSAGSRKFFPAPELRWEAELAKKTVMVLLLIPAMALLLGSCAYVNTKTPYDLDLNNTDLGTKVGVAEAQSVLWLVAWGDASYEAAARNGNINVLKHADQEIYQILLGVYTRWRVVVYGD